MRFRWFILLALLVALLVVRFLWIKPTQRVNGSHHPEAPEPRGQTHPNSRLRPPPSNVELPDPEDPRVNHLPDGRALFNPSVDASRRITTSTPAEESIEVISQFLEFYRYAYKENPVGDNSEITDRLLGNNPLKIVFISSDCAALLRNELVDSWGTPLFFHALSTNTKDMKVVSAGTDGELWTGDDLSTGGIPSNDS